MSSSTSSKPTSPQTTKRDITKPPEKPQKEKKTTPTPILLDIMNTRRNLFGNGVGKTGKYHHITTSLPLMEGKGCGPSRSILPVNEDNDDGNDDGDTVSVHMDQHNLTSCDEAIYQVLDKIEKLYEKQDALPSRRQFRTVAQNTEFLRLGDEIHSLQRKERKLFQVKHSLLSVAPTFSNDDDGPHIRFIHRGVEYLV
jgi:hypothetical protein